LEEFLEDEEEGMTIRFASPGRRTSWFLAVLATTLACSACSGKKDARVPVFPVHGQVLLNGKPVPYAFVVFHPVSGSGREDLHPRAHAEEDGSFWLSTYDSGDGAPAGEYVVTVQQYKAPTESDREAAVNLLPAPYASPARSKLRARVEAGDNELAALELKR
jgi:hypothetical protein